MLNGLRTPVERLIALADGREISFTQTALNDTTSLQLKLIPSGVCRPAYRVEFVSAPEFSPDIMTQDEGVLALYPHLAVMDQDGKIQPIPRHGFGDRYRKPTAMAINSAGTLIRWTEPSTVLVWNAFVTMPGVYRAEIETPGEYNQKPRRIDHRLTLTVEGTDGKSCVQTGWNGIDENGTTSGGTLMITVAGPKRITLRATALIGRSGASLKCIRLIPVNGMATETI